MVEPRLGEAFGLEGESPPFHDGLLSAFGFELAEFFVEGLLSGCDVFEGLLDLWRKPALWRVFRWRLLVL